MGCTGLVGWGGVPDQQGLLGLASWGVAAAGVSVAKCPIPPAPLQVDMPSIPLELNAISFTSKTKKFSSDDVRHYHFGVCLQSCRDIFGLHCWERLLRHWHQFLVDILHHWNHDSPSTDLTVTPVNIPWDMSAHGLYIRHRCSVVSCGGGDLSLGLHAFIWDVWWCVGGGVLPVSLGGWVC